MKTVILGAGAVGSAFAEAVKPVQVWRRGEPLRQDADFYLICMPDRAIGDVLDLIPSKASVAHTAGSVSIDVLARFARRGVVYPLQTFTKGVAVDLRQVPLFIEGDTRTFAESISDTVIEMSSADRLKLHLGAVLACNLVNALYAAAARVSGVDFGLYKALIEQTARKAAGVADPADVQTGPAVRGDRQTVEKQHELLAGDENLQRIYDLISQRIWEISKKTSPR